MYVVRRIPQYKHQGSVLPLTCRPWINCDIADAANHNRG